MSDRLKLLEQGSCCGGKCDACPFTPKQTKGSTEVYGYTAFDLDGTLFEKQEPFDPDAIGKPIKPMIARLRRHLEAGDEVRILTARGGAITEELNKRLSSYGVPNLRVSSRKMPEMALLYDDRAVGVGRGGQVKEARESYETDGGIRRRREARRQMIRRLVLGVGLTGGAVTSNRLAEGFLPKETRRLLDETARTYHQLERSRALSGRTGESDNQVVESYADLGSRLANAQVAGVKGKDLVKWLRSSFPVENKWTPHFSDAHYDAFSRGPLFGGGQLIDEHVHDMLGRNKKDTALRRYLSADFTSDFGEQLNSRTTDKTGQRLFNGTLREGLAYGGRKVSDADQRSVLSNILRDDELNKSRPKLFTKNRPYDLGQAMPEVKSDLAGGLMSSSFPTYLGIGRHAKNIHSGLSSWLPAALLLGGAGALTAGALSGLKSKKLTREEQRRLDKEKDEENEQRK